MTGSPPLREQKDAEQELELFTAGDFFVEDRAPTSEVDSLLFADDDSEKVYKTQVVMGLYKHTHTHTHCCYSTWF